MGERFGRQLREVCLHSAAGRAQSAAEFENRKRGRAGEILDLPGIQGRVEELANSSGTLDKIKPVGHFGTPREVSIPMAATLATPRGFPCLGLLVVPGCLLLAPIASDSRAQPLGVGLLTAGGGPLTIHLQPHSTPVNTPPEVPCPASANVARLPRGAAVGIS
jgi:hypothetical protein